MMGYPLGLNIVFALAPWGVILALGAKVLGY